MVAGKLLDGAAESQERVRRAEDDRLLRFLGSGGEMAPGDDSCETTTSQPQGNEMTGHTILGDVQYPTPMVINQSPAKSIAGPLITAALVGALGPAGVALGWYLNQDDPAPVVNELKDTSIEIGLLTEEELLDN